MENIRKEKKWEDNILVQNFEKGIELEKVNVRIYCIKCTSVARGGKALYWQSDQRDVRYSQ